MSHSYLENDDLEVVDHKIQNCIEYDSRAKRTRHFTMKVNDYDLAVFERLAASDCHTSKATAIRKACDEYLKQKGLV